MKIAWKKELLSLFPLLLNKYCQFNPIIYQFIKKLNHIWIGVTVESPIFDFKVKILVF